MYSISHHLIITQTITVKANFKLFMHNLFNIHEGNHCFQTMFTIMHEGRSVNNFTCINWGILNFVASGLDINGCVLSYFEGTANFQFYTNCTLTTLHCSKVSFLQCCHMKIYNTIFTKMCGVYLLLWDTVFNKLYAIIIWIKTNLNRTGWIHNCIILLS